MAVEAPGRTAAAELAAFCAAIRWSDLPTEARERAKELTLDLLGVGLRGSAEQSSQAAARVVRAMQASGGASVIAGGFSSGAAWAALANATASHGIELDDVTTESSLHPGVAVIPPAFALAEELGISPIAYLEAVVAGYEVTIRVGNALNPASSYARGFHPTGVAGVFGATMAAGRLLGLDERALVHALGIAGTMAAGSLEYLSDGAWTKRLNPGWASHAGIVAASLAKEGFTGPASVFDGRLGVLHAFTDEPYRERLLADLGKPLQVMLVSIKPYACCRYNHGLIDAALQLRREHDFRLEDVERIRLGVLSGGALLVADPIEQKRDPHNVVDAQFSAPYAAAVALTRGRGDVSVYNQQTIDDPAIRSLMAKTDCYRDSDLDAAYPRQWPAAAEVKLRDGRVLSAYVPYATGEPENPVSREALLAKFASLAEGRYRGDASALASRILRLEDEPDLRGIGAELRGG